MAEIATAYVSLIPSASKLGKGIESELGAAGDRAGTVGGEKAGKSLTAHLGGFLKKSLIGVGLAAGGLLATALTKGWGRLTNIENATAKLTGLGNSGQAVDAIMKNALASVKGTAFGLDEAATTAASAVAAGIKPGTELEGVLKTVADTATIAGKSMKDTGAIFGSVAARGKLQGDDLMQLQSAGVPVLAMLAKHYGITAAAASQMVTKGQVDFKNFNAALSENLGGAALKSGETTQGALKNMGAAFGRFGAALAGPVFGGAKVFFGGVTTAVDNLTAKVGPALQKVSAWTSNAIKAMTADLAGVEFGDAYDGINGYAAVVMHAMTRAGSAVAAFVKGIPAAFSANSWSDGFKAIKLGLQGITDDKQLDGLSGSLYGIGAAARKGFGQLADAAKSAVHGDFSGLADIGNRLLDGISQALPKLLAAARGLVQRLFDAITSNLPAIIAAGSQLLISIVTGMANRYAMLADAAAKILNGLVSALTTALPQLVEAGVQILGNVITGIVTALPKLANAAIGLVTSLISAITAMLPQLIDAGLQILTSLIDGVVTNLPKIVDMAANLVDTVVTDLVALLPKLIDGGLKLLDAIINGVITNLPKIVDAAINLVGKVVDTLINNLPKLISAGLQLLMGVINGIINNLPKLIDAAISILLKLVDALVTNIPKLLDAALQIIEGLIDYFTNPDNLLTIGKGALDIVVALVVGLGKLGWKLLEAAVTMIGQFISSIGTAIKNVWNAFMDLGKKVIDAIIEGIKATGSAIWNAIKSLFTGQGVVTIPVQVQATAKDFNNVLTNPASNSTTQALNKYFSGHASGGRLDEGYNMINERGPELLYKRGSSVDVITAGRTQQMMGDDAALLSKLDNLTSTVRWLAGQFDDSLRGAARTNRTLARAGG